MPCGSPDHRVTEVERSIYRNRQAVPNVGSVYALMDAASGMQRAAESAHRAAPLRQTAAALYPFLHHCRLDFIDRLAHLDGHSSRGVNSMTGARRVIELTGQDG